RESVLFEKPVMASNSSPVLPVSDPPPRIEERLFKGSAMTKRGAYAAVSYMSCAVVNGALYSFIVGCGANKISFKLSPPFYKLHEIIHFKNPGACKDFIRLHNSVAQHLQPWLYIYFAVLLVFFNKAALSSYSFPCANVITLFQMICSCSFLYVLRRWKLISFSAGESLTIADNSTRFVPLKTLIHTLPLALTYLLYMLATMESVRGVNVPMYTTLRRTTVVFTMFVEYILAGQKYTPPIVGR
ncbi:hypothetical protein RJ639_028805, partial [Escallonia herrerae]